MEAVMKARNESRTGISARAGFECQTHPPRRILVVEDEPELRQLVTEVLSVSGFRVDSAENGLVALPPLNAVHYDLMLVEEEMSIMTGLAREPDQIPDPQIQAMLMKPFTASELFRTVREVLHAADSVNHFRFLAPQTHNNGRVFMYAQ
jgi:DNA-binding response OmpR family regulator